MFLSLFLAVHQGIFSSGATPPISVVPVARTRGGAVSTAPRSDSSAAFECLAEFLVDRFPEATVQQLAKTLDRMAAAQLTFKGLDGAAHEAYQRTRGGDEIDTSISGRAQRSAARLAATAEAFLACELVEMVESSELVCDESLGGRIVVLNETAAESKIQLGKSSKLSILILHEPEYDGGAGLEHGSILSLADGIRPGPRKGRLLIVLADTVSDDLVEILSILNQKPKRIKLASGLVTEEVASVQPALYKAAGDLLVEIEPILRKFNTTAIHFVGRSLAGGVASLAASMLDGSVPLPKALPRKKKAKKQHESVDEEDLQGTTNTTISEPGQQPLSGLGRARCSAMTLGAPPCLSSNVLAAFCTSFLYGDDIVVRATNDSIERLCDRIQRNLNGGFVGRNIGWMSDALSLTVSSLQSHARGSEGEEATISVPGRAFLVRPRRLDGTSIHEVGNLKKGGREALRANLLWQLHDVLLSKSMWRHHALESYIHGLDRVQLRGTTDVQGQDLY
jgi:hypothetical protein